MTRTVKIDSIIHDLLTLYDHENPFFTITIDGDTVLSNDDFLLELANMFVEMSYISHSTEEYDVNTFTNLWDIYKKRHIDEWTFIHSTFAMDIDPLTDYAETKTITPDISVTSNITYGRTSTNSGGVSYTHGKTTTTQTNTYDGTLRDSYKSTDSGTDSTTDTTVNTLGGNDKNITRTAGSSTESKSGYKNNPFENLQRGVEYSARFNLRDMIISGFTKEFLFYDNDNGNGGCLYGVYY